MLRGHENYLWSAALSPDGTRIVTTARAVDYLSSSSDNTARIWDVRFATMSTQDLIEEVCLHRLPGMTKMTRDEMRLAGYPEDMTEIDIAEGMK